MLAGIVKRQELTNGPKIEDIVADICCALAKPVKRQVPDAHLGLDVWHCSGR